MSQRRGSKSGRGARSEAPGLAHRRKSAGPPIYRDGDQCALDPRDGEADVWVFRLISVRHASHGFTWNSLIPIPAFIRPPI